MTTEVDELPATVSDKSSLASKAQSSADSGFEPVWQPDFLKDFQWYLAEWSIRKGRAAIFADTGLGKTPIQLVYGQNVVEHTNRPFLHLTMLGDSHQTMIEADKFGVEVHRSRDGKIPIGARIVATNYEKLHLFDPADFAGVSCNESSVIKNFDGKRAGQVREFLRTIPYRLLCTATALPNDHQELGTSSEALGDLGYVDMLARFFKSNDGTLHPSRNYPRNSPKWSAPWGFRLHAEPHFWRWVCSWARACRKPSDLGYDDGDFILPPLEIEEHIVEVAAKRPGFLFEIPAEGLKAQQEERRRSIRERCEKAASLLDHDQSGVAWCHLNDEGDLLKNMIAGSEQISGADDDDAKEEKLKAFAAGEIRVLVTKPKIAGYGLNWQHCAHQTYFPSNSFEQYYQAIRRLWRFGQESPVKVDLISTEGGFEVMADLDRKTARAERQYARIVTLMNEAVRSEV